MPWCVPITWDDPFAAQFSGSPFGGATDGTAAVIPAGGTTEDLIKFWNDNNVPLGYTFRIEDGCICVDSADGAEPPVGIKVGFDPGDPTPTSGNHTANFSEINKEPVVDEDIQACLDCFEALFGCSFLDMIPEDMPLTKASIVEAIQAGIAELGGGGPTVETFTGSIVGLQPWPGTGFNPTTGLGTLNGTMATPGTSCDPDDDFGYLVVDLGLPAGVEGAASTTVTVLDASAGMGAAFLFDKDTGWSQQVSIPGGGAGNGIPVPFDHTMTYTIPPSANSAEICLVISAFGSQGAGPFADTCDSIAPGESIVTVTEDPCGGAKACFEEIFGCPIDVMAGEAGLSVSSVEAIVGAALAGIEHPDNPIPAILVPPADNEVDTAIRTGQVGTSLRYAREDHNHPIRRQTNPGDPVMTFGGQGEMTASLILDRWSDEESYTFGFRNDTNQDPGNGWGWIVVPNIAGFQRPEINSIGTYRTGSTAVQEDELGGSGGIGAGPRGPYMGKEASHWSSTQRVYLGYFRRDNQHRTFVEFNTKYTRL